MTAGVTDDVGRPAAAGPVIDPHLAPRWESSALVVIDMQRDFLSESPYGLAGTTEIIPALRTLADAFRSAARPIVHVVRLYPADSGDADRVRRTMLAGGARFLRPGSEGRLPAPGLLPEDPPDLDDDLLLAGRAQQFGPDEYVIFKPRWGAFYRTPLDGLLIEQGVDTLVFAGCNLPNCPRASIIEASERDYRIVLATDAVSQATAQGLTEVAAIGTVLMTVDDITAAVDAR